MRQVKCLEYRENANLIQKYFNALFFFEKENVVDVLKRFSRLKGYIIDDYQECWFTTELQSRNDGDYSKEEGIVFVFSEPLVAEDCAVLLTYEEFFKEVKERYEKYLLDNIEQRDEIAELLECLKNNLKV